DALARADRFPAVAARRAPRAGAPLGAARAAGLAASGARGGPFRPWRGGPPRAFGRVVPPRGPNPLRRDVTPRQRGGQSPTCRFASASWTLAAPSGAGPARNPAGWARTWRAGRRRLGVPLARGARPAGSPLPQERLPLRPGAADRRAARPLRRRAAPAL